MYDRPSGTFHNTRWVTGLECILLPGVVGTVAVGVLDVEAVFQCGIALEAIPGPLDGNPRTFIPYGPVSPQHVVVSRDQDAADTGGTRGCGSGEVIDQAISVSTNKNASA